MVRCAPCWSAPGIHDILSKSLGSDNAINVVHATIAALKMIQRPEEVAARRGLPLEDVAPAQMLRARAAAAAGVEVVMAARTTARPRTRPEPTAQSTPTTDTVLRVTQVRSTIGCKQNQRATLLSLGLRKIRQTVERRRHAADPRHDPHRPPPRDGRGGESA